MSDNQAQPQLSSSGVIGFIERAGKKIPDPVIIFMFLFAFCLALTAMIGGLEFEALGADGGMVQYSIKSMVETEHFRWLFDNAILANWLGFGGGVLGVILIVMLGVGVAENSGMLAAVIKKIGLRINDKYLPILVVFLGIMSSIATDA